MIFSLFVQHVLVRYFVRGQKQQDCAAAQTEEEKQVENQGYRCSGTMTW